MSVARDAALRGLTVSLVEQGDFGNAASSNHHKIIHGGFRYLQHADFSRMRESIKERNILMRMAPHLVHPLPCVIPTYGHRLKEKLMFAVALKLNDLISFDRNRKLREDQKIPAGRILSTAQCLQLCPNIDQRGLSGGALFFDAQVDNPDRLNLSVLFSAAAAGADFANYVEMTEFLRDGSAVSGIRVRDTLSGAEFAIRARVVVNCTGPRPEQVLHLLGRPPSEIPTKLLKAIVLVTRPVVGNTAVGIRSTSPYTDRDAVVQKGYRFFFITPWRHKSLVGTFETPYKADRDGRDVSENEITDFLRQINDAFSGARLQREDVVGVLSGLVPAADAAEQNSHAQRQNHWTIRDHGAEDGIPGLLSVVGVKYTTARGIAERTVNLVLTKLGRKFIRSRTAETPVAGAVINGWDEFADRAAKERTRRISTETLRHLLQCYGSEYRNILRYCDEDSRWSRSISSDAPTIRAEVLHGIRSEMARKLSDIIFRRTELGTAGHPGDACLHASAEIMRAELNWNKATMFRELDEVQQGFSYERQPSRAG